MRTAKERIIYSNYDLWDQYKDQAQENINEANEYLLDEKQHINPTDEELWNTIYFLDSINWDDEKSQLKEFFNDGSTWILQGTTGRWDGTHKGGYIFTDFSDMFNKAMKDCDYVKFSDKNGHFYLECSHHDGTNHYEIKRMTDAGVEYYERWNYSWSDQRSEEHVHDMIMKRYSTLPHYVHKVYGAKKIEYEINAA